MKQDYTMYIDKADRRCKSGERAVSTTVWRNRVTYRIYLGTDPEIWHALKDPQN